MKNIFSVLLISILVSSCTNFLDVEPKGKSVLAKYENYEGLLNNSFLNGLQFLKFTATSNAETGDMGYSFSILGEVQAPFFMSDDIVANPNTFNNYTQIQKNMYRWQGDVYLVDDNAAEWGTMYSLNYVYNLIANGIMDTEGGTINQKQGLLAEARTARAHMHFWTAQLFALPYEEATASQTLGIPLITEANTELKNVKRATLSETYQFIIDELEQAIPHLPNETYNRSRISKAAGYYILGETYFYMTRYDKALMAFKQCQNYLNQTQIAIGTYDYNKKVPTWWIGFMPNMGLLNHPNPFDSEESIYVKQSAAPIYSAMASQSVLHEQVYNLFGPNDLRLKIFSNRGLMSSSLQLPGYQRAQPGTVNYGPSVPNLILMTAECEARANELQKAEQLLVDFRKHRMPETDAAIVYAGQEALVRLILEERQREFAATGLRWLDMRRLYNDPTYNNLRNSRTINGQTVTLRPERLCLRIPPMTLGFNPDMPNNK